MTAWEGAAQAADLSVEAPPLAEAAPVAGAAQDLGLGPALSVHLPDAPAEALVFASPHSGRDYPAELMAAAALDAAAIRRSEDAFVDELIASGPAYGAAVITARYARAFIDVNREAYELDPAMFEDELPPFARARTARVAAGLGSIARVVGEGQEIYRRKLTFAEARRRIEGAHRPYHQALAELLGQTRARHGRAALIDWHSMPSAASSAGDRARRGCDMVLGDRFGSACAPELTRVVERELEAMGYRVARNAPYAGGYTTEFYGRPRPGEGRQLVLEHGRVQLVGLAVDVDVGAGVAGGDHRGPVGRAARDQVIDEGVLRAPDGVGVEDGGGHQLGRVVPAGMGRGEHQGLGRLRRQAQGEGRPDQGLQPGLSSRRRRGAAFSLHRNIHGACGAFPSGHGPMCAKQSACVNAPAAPRFIAGLQLRR